MKLQAAALGLFAALMFGGTATGQSTLPGAESDSMSNFPPSYQVHITPTQMVKNSTSGRVAPDYWSARGYDLNGILAKVYEVDARRIELPAALKDGTRYDFVVALPEAESQSQFLRRIQQAIGEHFHLRIALEAQSKDVYVLSAPTGKTPAIKVSQAAAGIFGSALQTMTVEVPSSPDGPPTKEEIEETARKIFSDQTGPGSIRGISSIQGISVSESTMEEFCHTLEMGLDRLVIDETNLKGTYDLEVHGEAKNAQELFALIHDQLGLMLTPATRSGEMLVVRQQ